MPRLIGDSVFVRNGAPGVVVNRDAAGVRVDIQQHGPQLEETQKRGYINGLNPVERSEFNQVIDQMRAIKDPKQRVQEMRGVIEELRKDPQKGVLTKYLESELIHTMISYNIKATEYVTDDLRIR
jgi:hypothetical protein